MPVHTIEGNFVLIDTLYTPRPSSCLLESQSPKELISNFGLNLSPFQTTYKLLK